LAIPDSEISLHSLLPLYDVQKLGTCVDLSMNTIVPDYCAHDIKNPTGVITIFFDELYYFFDIDLQIPQVIYSNLVDKRSK
jgi:hypothetical protein